MSFRGKSLFTRDPVTVSIQAINIWAYNIDRTPHVSGSVSRATSTVHITSNGNACALIAGVTFFSIGCGRQQDASSKSKSKHRAILMFLARISGENTPLWIGAQTKENFIGSTVGLCAMLHQWLQCELSRGFAPCCSLATATNLLHLLPQCFHAELERQKPPRRTAYNALILFGEFGCGRVQPT